MSPDEEFREKDRIKTALYDYWHLPTINVGPLLFARIQACRLDVEFPHKFRVMLAKGAGP